VYNPFSLENKIILVTGASSGIGRAIAIECSKMGASVIITGRNEERLKETHSRMEGNQPDYIIADLSNSDDVQNLCKNITSLTGLVNCAGLTKVLPFPFAERKDFEEVMEVNFLLRPSFLDYWLNQRKYEKVLLSFLFLLFRAFIVRQLQVLFIHPQKVQSTDLQRQWLWIWHRKGFGSIV